MSRHPMAPRWKRARLLEQGAGMRAAPALPHTREVVYTAQEKAMVCFLVPPVGGLHCLTSKTRVGLRDRDYDMG